MLWCAFVIISMAGGMGGQGEDTKGFHTFSPSARVKAGLLHSLTLQKLCIYWIDIPQNVPNAICLYLLYSTVV